MAIDTYKVAMKLLKLHKQFPEKSRAELVKEYFQFHDEVLKQLEQGTEQYQDDND
jgi:hypothetical protein